MPFWDRAFPGPRVGTWGTRQPAKNNCRCFDSGRAAACAQHDKLLTTANSGTLAVDSSRLLEALALGRSLWYK